MTDWKPGDPLYDYREDDTVRNPLFEFKSCNPEKWDVIKSRAHWSPDKGWRNDY